MATHVVKIEIRGEEFWYSNPCVHVQGGDTIKWKLANPLPYGIVIKAPVSPLKWRFKAARKNLWITGIVRATAHPGHYFYGVGAVSGQDILFDDPEIIVEQP